MTVAEIAAQLLTHFSPEERAVPESATYPGRHAAVKLAINGALQECFAAGSPWMHKVERGVILNPPATGVRIAVTNGSTEAEIQEADWQSWFAGNTIEIDGSAIQNRITNADMVVVLKFPHDGTTAIYQPATIQVSGTLTADGSATVEFPPLYAFPVLEGETSWHQIWLDDSSYNYETNPPTDDVYYRGEIFHSSEGPGFHLAILTKFLGEYTIAKWYKSGIDPGITSLTEVDWTGTAVSPATGVPVATDVPEAPGFSTATIYHHSSELATDVLELHGPVKLDGMPILPAVDEADDETTWRRDFGFPLDSSNSLSKRKVFYKVESWFPSDTSGPVSRLVLSHYPTKTTFLEYTAHIVPLVVMDITATQTLPIPHQWIQSVFYPIARKRLAGCEFFRAGNNAQEIVDSYAEARRILASLNTRRSSGAKIKAVY